MVAHLCLQVAALLGVLTAEQEWAGDLPPPPRLTPKQVAGVYMAMCYSWTAATMGPQMQDNFHRYLF